MPARNGKSRKPDEGHQDFVPAVFAKDADEAESYAELLKDHDIPAICGTGGTPEEAEEPKGGSPGGGMTRGVPVLVPESLLDEASEIIADRENVAELGLDNLEEDDEEDEEELGYPEELDAEVQGDVDDEDDFLDDEDLEEDEDI